MIQKSYSILSENSDFDALGVSCPEESFIPLLSISIKEYVTNLRSTFKRLELRRGDRVLVFRTASIHLMEALLSILFETAPDITVDIVTQRAFLPYIRHKMVNPIIIPDGPISKQTFSHLKLQKSHYRLALVPYSNAHGNGYDNVIQAVNSIFLGKRRGIGSNGRLRTIYRYPRIARAFMKPLRAISYALMIVILIGMALWFKGWIPLRRRITKKLSQR